MKYILHHDIYKDSIYIVGETVAILVGETKAILFGEIAATLRCLAGWTSKLAIFT